MCSTSLETTWKAEWEAKITKLAVLCATVQTPALHIHPFCILCVCSKDSELCHASTDFKKEKKEQQMSYITLNKAFQNAIKPNSFSGSNCQCDGKTNLLLVQEQDYSCHTSPLVHFYAYQEAVLLYICSGSGSSLHHVHKEKHISVLLCIQ